ncbi:MAG: Mut7-C RNAse domain-containing protein [Planctomycetes bacterium]|nr:Mut7-C RNAse domain-containing protein [Planctomycetota bacterium]
MPKRFVVDSMLEKLARYLRCAGLDAASDPTASTATRVEWADREDRVFLTRNRHLEHHALVPRRLVRLASEDPLAQFAELRDAGHLAGAAPFTRCLRCNAPLAPLPRADAAGRVPPRVHAAHTEFFTCPRCAAIFWRGSHVRTTCRSLGLEDVAESGGAGARPAAPDAPA